MALQLAPQEETVHQLIPFYCGNLDEKPLDVNKVGAVLVQIKYRKQETKPLSVLGENFFPPKDKRARITHPTSHNSTHDTLKYITGDGPASKRLFLLVDLGSNKNSVDVSVSEYSNPDIWAIHVNGHGEGVFSCPGKHKAQEYAGIFFNNMNIFSEKHIAFVHDKDLLENVVRHDKFCEVPKAASVSSTRKRKVGGSSSPTRVTPRRVKKKKSSIS